MPSPDAEEKEPVPTSAKKPKTPRQSPAVRQTPNTTPTRKLSAQKAGKPHNVPARAKSGANKPEPTLLGDFLLGRPSVNRSRRKSSIVVRTEMKKDAVDRLQPPGGVKSRVKQWQKASAAAVGGVADPLSEPDELFVDMDSESVTEEDRRRIKFRKHQTPKSGRRKSTEKNILLVAEKVVASPKKRVVSDDHWVTKKEKQSPPRTSKAMLDKTSRGSKLPKDFLKKTSENPPLETKIEDWAKRIDGGSEIHSLQRSRKMPKTNPLDDMNRSLPSRASSISCTTQVPLLSGRGIESDTKIKSSNLDGTQGSRERQTGMAQSVPRPRNENRRKRYPVIEKLSADDIPSKSADGNEELPGLPVTPSRTPRSKTRQRRSLSTESMLDIPVGYSAFSVLDIPVGGDASAMRTTKPSRQPSLSAVPKVLKKVYAGGMRIMQDTVDPPRIGINQPPSIESWLKGTSDPFVDDIPLAKNLVALASPKNRRRSNSKDTPSGGEHNIESHMEGESHNAHRSEMTDKVLPNKKTNAPGRDDETAMSTGISIQRSLDEGIKSKLAPAGLKRSPATRNTSSPKSPKKPSSDDKSSHLVYEEPVQHSVRRSSGLVSRLPEIQNKVQSCESGGSAAAPNSSVFIGEPSGALKEQRLGHKPRIPSASRSDKLDVSGLSQNNPSSQTEVPLSGKHRLSTIASVETFTSSSYITETASDVSQTTATRTTVTQNTTSTRNSSNTSNTSNGKGLGPSASQQLSIQPGLKRRLTKHSDLISVLSLPENLSEGRTKSIRPAHSIRTNRSHLATATLLDLLHEIADDEVKYMRELKTLVDGVIPVLLTCVISKSKSAATAGLLYSTASNNQDSLLTKPIVDMGIALERLRNLHKYVPVHDSVLLVHWASGASKIYDEYLTAWRMGFKDVIVNLAPASETDPNEDQVLPDEMLRNKCGDVLNENGERVDVAFLLKRPLVRVKYLARAMKGISTLKPSEQAAKANDQFEALFVKTRRRIKEEEARLEDQAANSIDKSRARDPRTLAPIEGVTIDQTRQVIAKDFFDFGLAHSSGQRIDCRVEIILRDKPQNVSDPGDVLICEIDSLGRWLLFPPLELNRVSARLGNDGCELVVMIRSIQDSQKWCEMFKLASSDAETVNEWVEMLGLAPKPPKLLPTNMQEARATPSFPPGPPNMELEDTPTHLSTIEALPYCDDDVPIGEQRRQRNGASEQSSKPIETHVRQSTDRPHSMSKCDVSARYKDPSPSGSVPGDFDDAMDRDGKISRSSSSIGTPSRYRPKGGKEFSERLSNTPSRKGHLDGNHGTSCKLPNNRLHDPHSKDTYFAGPHLVPSSTSPIYSILSSKQPGVSLLDSNQSQKGVPSGDLRNQDDSWKNNSSRSPTQILDTEVYEKPPQPPPHRSSSHAILSKSPLAPKSSSKSKSRRSSSPLKHEYQPSDASDTSTASDELSSTDSGEFSDSSDEELEAVDVSIPPVDSGENEGRSSIAYSLYGLPNASLSPSNSASHAPYRGISLKDTVGSTKLVAAISCWSHKGCWVDLHPEDCSIVVSPGLIEAFVMSASHSSGIIPEKELLSSGPLNISSETSDGASRPLVGLELTPIVPLRQSNALDIEIRSPPTARSTATCTHTIRFRSRSLQECSGLYAAIHSARMDNPVYKRLEQERIVNSYGKQTYQEENTGNTRRSWFGRSKSYRATARAPSVTISDNSIKSFASAISRLRNMGGVGGFNIAKSSVGRSQVSPLGTTSGATSLYTGSTRSATSGITPPRTPMSPSVAMTGTSNVVSLGSSNLRIRLYLLETSSRWSELGNASLTVTHPPHGMRQASSLYHGVEKRLIVTKRQSTNRGLGKKISGSGSPQGEESESSLVLLDVVLGGGCFSRIGVVGVAMNVWEDVTGDNGEIGTVGAVGGVSGRTRKWMFQCASAAEATWIFALVGGVDR